LTHEYHVSFIKQHFPTTSTLEVAASLNISVNRVRTIAKKHNVKKCNNYLSQLKKQLVINQRNWFESSIPSMKPTHIQEQLLFGSILGDGY